MQQPQEVRDRAAQLLFIRMGSNMNPPIRAHDEVDRISAVVGRCPVGGLLLFNGVFGETGAALRTLQEQSRYPLLVGADMERGAGQQLLGATVFPHAMALSVRGVDAVEDARAIGRITAEEALSEGVAYVLGPVADLNRNPKNPIIGTRAFGADPRTVARLVRAYVEGCRSVGALVAPKHFPGHGNTAADSHSEVPGISGTLGDFEETDLVPFQSAIDAGCDTVMTAHAAYPQMDPSGRVATNSPVILREVLRSRMGFTGAAVTDSLLMAGIRQSYSDTGEMVVDLIRSGQDLLLDVDDAELAVEAIVEALANGSLSRSTFDGAFGRAWALKERLARTHGPRWHIEPRKPPPPAVVAKNTRLARDIARRGLVVPPDDFRSHDVASSIFVMVKPYRTHLDPKIEPLGHMVTDNFAQAAYYQIGDDSEDELLDEVRQRSTNVTNLVVAVAVRPAAWRRFGLSDRLAKYVRGLLESADQALLVVLGSPEALGDFRYDGPSLYTYSDVEASQRAAFDWITSA